MKLISLTLGASLALLPLLALAAEDGPPPSSVLVAKAALRAIAPTLTVTGVVQSRSGADLSAPTAGRLIWVAEPGTPVRAGDVVARFDMEEMRLLRGEQAARIARGEVAVRSAQREVERMTAAGGAVAKIQLAQAEDARDLARSDLGIARATLAQTDERLSKSTLRAAAAGVISERVKRAGEEAARGDVIARVASPQNLELRLFLPLKHIAAITPGTSVQVHLGNAAPQPAPVRAVVPVGDARTQSFDAFVDLAGVKPAATVGDTLQVEIPLSQQRNALVVPRDAVVIRADGAYVFRLKGAGKSLSAERIPVRMGVAQGSDVAVEGALAAGDSVVIRGAETLEDGALVRVVDLHSAQPVARHLA